MLLSLFIPTATQLTLRTCKENLSREKIESRVYVPAAADKGFQSKV